MDVSSKMLMNNHNSGMMSIPDIIPSNVMNGEKSIMNGIKNSDKSIKNGELKKSSSIHLEVDIESVKRNPILLPTCSSYNHLATMMGDHCTNNVRKTVSNKRMDQVPNICDGDDEEMFNSLIPVRTRAGTADGSTQTSRSHHRSGGSNTRSSNIRSSNTRSSNTRGNSKHLPLMHESSSMDRSECDFNDDENTELDGGFWAWIVVLGAFLTNGIIFGVINCFGVIFKQIQDKFSTDGDTSSFLTSCVGSLAIGMTFLCSFIASISTDCIGVRRTAVLGGILATTGMFCSSFATSFTHLYITYGLMFGIGASLAYTPSLVILGHYFSRRLGIVNGVVTAGSSVFTMIMSVSLKALSESNDFQTNMRILAGLMSLLILCGMTFIERKPRTGTGMVRASMKRSKESGEKVSGFDTFKEDGHRRMSSSSLSSSLASSGSGEVSKRIFNTEIWKNKLYVVWSVAIPVALFGYFVPYVHLVEHVRLILPEVNGAILVTTIGASSGIGRLIFGNIADAPGVNRIFLQQIAFVSIGILTLLLTLTDNLFSLLAICVGLGIFDGCFIAVLGPIAFDLVGKDGAPQAIGFLLAFCSIPLTIGPPVAGKIFDAFKSYKYAFLIAGLPPFIGALMMWPIFSWQRSMAAKEAQMVVSKNGGRDGEEEEEETSSGTGVSPTVITGLSSASPSNVMMNQSSCEEHTSLDILPDDSDLVMNRAMATTDVQDQVIHELVQRCQDSSNLRKENSFSDDAKVDETLIKFTV